ncbi:MAG: aminotransferase class I/II-fold pyridoxal phosphate-dependent enzyme, partial [candidate division NC10 bacterium]
LEARLSPRTRAIVVISPHNPTGAVASAAELDALTEIASRHALPIIATAARVLGAPIGANLVALGALVALSGVVGSDALERAVAARRPGGSVERALLAVRAGVDLVATARGTPERTVP